MEERYYWCYAASVACAIGGFLAATWQERGKRLDGKVEAIREKVWELADAAETYWCLEGKAEARTQLATKIKQSGVRVAAELSEANAEFTMFQFTKWRSVTQLRQAATDGRFEGKGREPEPERGKRIRLAAEALVAEVVGARRRIM